MDKQDQTPKLEENKRPSAPEDQMSAQFKEQLESMQSLYNEQTALVQRFLESQASLLAEAVVQRLSQVRFSLPDRVVIPHIKTTKPVAMTVPPDHRMQMAGRLRDRLSRTDMLTALHDRFLELEHSENAAIATGAGLLRFTTAVHMIHNMLPAGRTVTYTASKAGDIPNIPVVEEMDVESAITEATDAIVEEGRDDNGRGQLQVPFVPAARRFFLPQWVAFDEQGDLLVNSANQAEAYLASMQNYISILKSAQFLCPYITADGEFHQKRNGITGQLVNQGRALAVYEVKEIIHTIQRRASAGDLNRGLSLDLPFFNDQSMGIETWSMEIIPKGRIMFIPSFVVRSTNIERMKVQENPRLSNSTREHLLSLLSMLEVAFDTRKNPSGKKIQ